MTTNTGNREWSYDEIKKLIDEGYDAVIMNAKEKDPSSWFSASEIIPLDNLRVIQNLKKIQKKGGEQKYGIDRLLKNLENYKNKITVTKNTKRNKKVGSEYYIEIPHPSIKNQKLRVGSVNTNNSGGISGINIKDKFSTMGINTLLHNLAS
jgi:predicted metal-dependent hydrolase